VRFLVRNFTVYVRIPRTRGAIHQKYPDPTGEGGGVEVEARVDRCSRGNFWVSDGGTRGPILNTIPSFLAGGGKKGSEKFQRWNERV